MAPGLFWGVLLILIGLAAIFRVVFNIHLFSVFIALFLIFIGVTMLIGKPLFFNHHKGRNDTVFEDRAIYEQPRNNSEYNVVFGKSVYDFTNIQFKDNEPIKIKINTVFGNSQIRIRKDMPVKIKSDAVFASASMPDGNSVAFGTIHYTTDSLSGSLQHLYIEAPVVFGSIQVTAE